MRPKNYPKNPLCRDCTASPPLSKTFLPPIAPSWREPRSAQVSSTSSTSCCRLSLTDRKLQTPLTLIELHTAANPTRNSVDPGVDQWIRFSCSNASLHSDCSVKLTRILSRRCCRRGELYSGLARHQLPERRSESQDDLGIQGDLRSDGSAGNGLFRLRQQASSDQLQGWHRSCDCGLKLCGGPKTTQYASRECPHQERQRAHALERSSEQEAPQGYRRQLDQKTSGSALWLQGTLSGVRREQAHCQSFSKHG